MISDPHLLLRIALEAKEPVVHLAFLARRPYAALCAHESVQFQLMDAFTKQNRRGNWTLPNGKLHSPDRFTCACIETSKQTKLWYRNGEVHRDDDLPAAESEGKFNAWYKNDALHRDGGLPAIIKASGSRVWYKHGLLHRESDEPAVICVSGDSMWLTYRPELGFHVVESATREWWVDGKLHREDGPAFITDDEVQWYKNGIQYTPIKTHP